MSRRAITWEPWWCGSLQRSLVQTSRKKKKVLGELARHGEVFLLVPTTYMNNSGDAVRKCLDYFKIEIEDLLIVADDIAIPFGTFRYREKGSYGGHNGLLSIEEALGSREYSRLRIGIGDREHGDLADYVLSRFTREEQEKLPGLIDEGVKQIDKWIKLGEE